MHGQLTAFALLALLAGSSRADEPVTIYVHLDLEKLSDQLLRNMPGRDAESYTKIREKLVLSKLRDALPVWDLKEWTTGAPQDAYKLTIRLKHGSTTAVHDASLDAELWLFTSAGEEEALIDVLALYTPGSFRELWQANSDEDLYEKMLAPFDAEFRKKLSLRRDKLKVIPVGAGYTFEAPKHAILPLEWRRVKALEDSEFRLEIKDDAAQTIEVHSRILLARSDEAPQGKLVKIVHTKVRINNKEEEPENVKTLNQYTKGLLFVIKFVPRLAPVGPGVGIATRRGG